MKIKKTLLFSVIIFSLFSSLFSINALGLDDINYTLEKDIIYTSTNPLANNSFNVRNITEYTELYNATYSFTNEINGTSGVNITFINIDNSNINTGSRIIPLLDGHKKVLELFDNNVSGFFDLITEFNLTQNFGTIDWWWRTDNTNFLNQMMFRQNTTRGPRLLINDGFIKYIDGGTNNIVSVINNKWYHLRLDFECSVSGYEGLASDTFFITINGIKYGSFPFDNPLVEIDNIWFISSTTDFDYSTFIDGIGYSWDNFYSIGNNLIPFISVNTTNKEINHYDFALREPDKTYPIGYGYHGAFIQNWEILGNEATITVDNSEVFASIPYLRDRAIRFEQTGVGGGGAIQKTNMELIDNFIDITLGFSVSVYDINGGYIQFAVYSEAPILVDLRIYKTVGIINLAYYDGSYNDLYSGLNLNDIYFIDLLVNLEIDRGFIQLYENDTIVIDHNFPLVNNNELKVDNVDFGTHGNVGNHLIVDVDDIGIYKSGRSYIEFNSTFMYFNFIFGKTWLFKQQSLFSMIGNGTLSLYGRCASGDVDYYPSVFPFPGATMYFLEDFISHDNSLYFYNLHTFEQTPHFQFARLIIYSRDTFSINFLNIEGSKLTEGLNEYPLNFSYSNININNSYFYTDSLNRLQFNHHSDDFAETEFIQARFNINDTTSTGARISYQTLINNNAIGSFRINYTTTSDFLLFPTVEATTSILLTQGKIIRDFIIIITDLGSNTTTGLTSGFIDNIKLLYLENIQITIITLSLIGMLVPLIIILSPTLTLADLYGEGFIIPIFLLMSLILTIGEIIPIWLFFIIAISSSLFLIKRREVKEG